MNSRAQTILDYSIVSMIAGMILSTVSSQKIPSLLFYILIAASCLNWYVHYRKGTSTEGIELKQHKTLFILCSVSLIAVLVSKAVHLNMSGTEIEKAVRFSIGLPLLYAGLRFVPYERLIQAFWGVFAAIVFQFYYIFELSWPNFNRPYTADIHNAVTYGVLLLLLSVICIFTLPIRLTRFSKTEGITKVVVFFLGILAFLLTQTRTGLLALPLFVFIGVLLFYRGRIFKVCIVFLCLLSILAASVLSIPMIQKRTKLALDELSSCLQEDSIRVNSICVRIQLLRAGIVIWQDNPIFGTSDNNEFQKIMKTELVNKRIVSEYAANDFGEPHNDYVQNLSSFGLVGLLGFLLIYFSPAVVFIRRFRRWEKKEKNSLAAIGVSVCLGFVIFSLPELMFRNMRTISFYTTLIVLVIVLLDLYSRSEQRRLIEN